MRKLSDLDYTTSEKEVVETINENPEEITRRYEYYLDKVCKKNISEKKKRACLYTKVPQLLANNKIDFNKYTSLYITVYLERCEDLGRQYSLRLMSDACLVIRLPKEQTILYAEKNRFVIYKLTCFTKDYTCLNIPGSTAIESKVLKVPWHFIYRFMERSGIDPNTSEEDLVALLTVEMVTMVITDFLPKEKQLQSAIDGGYAISTTSGLGYIGYDAESDLAYIKTYLNENALNVHQRNQYNNAANIKNIINGDWVDGDKMRKLGKKT